MTINPLENLDPSLTQSGSLPGTEKTQDDIIDQAEFLELLVTQLQNQDPLDPMANEEFAVQLAQFTQVEQLIAINDKLEPEASGADFSSLASYLGNEVWLDSDVVSVADSDGGEVAFELAEDAASVQVELVDSAGVVREVVDAGALSKGSNRVALSGLSTPSGDFQARVVATSASGEIVNPEVSVAGLVSGFVPGPSPTLIVGNQEVGTAEIKRVQVPGQ